MKIAVIGAGAIGGLCAAYLKLAGRDVTVAVKASVLDILGKHGLSVSGVRGEKTVKVPVTEKIDFIPDLCLVAVKTQDIQEAASANPRALLAKTVVTTQNGLRAEELLLEYCRPESIVSGIVMFGATSLQPGRIVHNFEGSLVLGGYDGCSGSGVTEAEELFSAVFPVQSAGNIKGMKLLKVFINAGNCIPAILGTTMQEAFSDLRVCGISAAVWKEGLRAVLKAGLRPESLPGFPAERVFGLAAMPLEQAAGVFHGIMSGLSGEPLYGSILQSIKKGRPSEIDYFNGEFVRIAAAAGEKAGLNELLVRMVHDVERGGRFFQKEELLRETARFLD